MSPTRLLRLLLALSLLLLTASPRAADPRPEGTIEADGAQAEVLSRPLPVGKRIELPEGWFRVEEEGTEDRSVGSFTVVAAEPRSEEPATPPVAEVPPLATPTRGGPAILPSTPRGSAACRAERNAYLRQVWKESGIDVEDPDALIEGLDAGTAGPETAYDWFALQADPFRNLSWSSALRDRARELERCMIQARSARR